jgi:carboxypeptidase T
MKTLIRAWFVTLLMGSLIQAAWAADYRTYDEVQTALLNLSLSNPGIARYFSRIGTTVDGRNIPAIKITKDPQFDDPNKPDILFLGGHHAREWISIEVPLRLAEYLVANYTENLTVQSLVDSREIWIVPIVNPDGYIFSYAEAENRLWRKNRRPLMFGFFGVDLNRNYDYMWGTHSSSLPFMEDYHGTSAFSEPETQTIRNFIEGRAVSNNPITRLLDYHSYSQLILYPWGDTPDPAPDAALFKQIAEEMRDRIKAVHGVQYTAQQSVSLYPTSGTIDDWAYAEKGILAFTIELRPGASDPAGFELPTDQIVPTFDENLPAALYFIGLSRGRLMDFEDGTDAAPISSTIPGMQFSTTEGYDWIYADWRTEYYNGPYPSGAYFSNGNFFAWLGPNQGFGRIDFTDSTQKTVGLSYSSLNSTFLEAYDASDTLIESVSGPGNLSTGQLGKLGVSGDISYVLVHDAGNFWLIDDLFVTDGLADAQAMMPGKYKRELEVVESFDVGTIKEFTLFIKQGTDLKIVLEWPGSIFNIKVIDPAGNVVNEEESSAPPIIIDLQTTSTGNWQIVVTAVQVDQAEPASLVVGAFEPEDIDSDGIMNNADNCPNVINPYQTDTDGDGVGDACDNCPTTPNEDQLDMFPLDGPEGPGNGIGDVCENLPEDMDQDGIANSLDNCPYVSNLDQEDSDMDGVGNACDNCPLTYNPDQVDSDKDGIGDACEVIQVPIDIKPCSCPNPLNVKSKGVLPLAVLGTKDFDVATIDPTTIRLSREDVKGTVAPIRWSYEDVATPFEGELCGCHALMDDGYMDLSLKFDTQALVSTLKLKDIIENTIPFTLTGNLKKEFGGIPIKGQDCIQILE